MWFNATTGCQVPNVLFSSVALPASVHGGNWTRPTADDMAGHRFTPLFCSTSL